MPRTEEQKAQKRITDAAYRARNRERIREEHRQWLLDHPGRDAAYSRKRRKKNPQATKAEWKKWRAKNPQYQRAISKKWAKSNRPKINARERERCANDPAYRLAKRLRNRVREAIKKGSGKKSTSTIILTGCDVQFLMGYLEARFAQGMTWKNHGTVWEIDHRIPCASYDMNDASHQRSCFHYSNLQPLFIMHNRQKHDALPGPHQAELL